MNKGDVLGSSGAKFIFTELLDLLSFDWLRDESVISVRPATDQSHNLTQQQQTYKHGTVVLYLEPFISSHD
jgi:hypothetical protein